MPLLPKIDSETQIVLDVGEHYITVLVVRADKSFVVGRIAVLKDATVEPALLVA